MIERFRAWDGKMHYSMGNLSLFFEWYEKNMTSRLMQAIGMKDKKGKEIFENDIVRYTVKPHASKTRPKYRVCYSTITGGWDLEAVDDKGYANVGRVDWERTTVIGNIWEHPKLAGEKT